MVHCYDLHSSKPSINYDDVPCEDVSLVHRNVTCCVRGSTCMSNGICQNHKGTVYYSADCTDPTLQDPICQSRCGGFIGSQITYNKTSGLWACCTYINGLANCNIPTDALFPAPAPSDLKTIQYLPKTGLPTYSTPSATATHTTTTKSSSHSLSTGVGTAAGVGVGVGVGIVLIAMIIVFFFLRRRRLSEKELAMQNRSTSQQSRRRRSTYIYELGHGPPASELDSHAVRELDSEAK